MNKAFENMMYKLFFTCEEATFLIEKKASAQPIAVIDNFRLKGHLMMCKWCRAYEKKVIIIDSALERISSKANDKLEEAEIIDFTQQLIETTFKVD